MFRFSLRAVFVMTLLAAVGIAFIYHYVRPYRLQAIYIDRHQGTSTVVSADPVGPKWLQRILGDLACVQSLAVSRFDAEDAAAVAAMTDLQFVTLSGTIDDRIAPCFKDMANLIKVDATYSFVSMRALEHLPNPEKVRELKLGVNTHDDDLVELLPKFSGLRKLDLQATQISDQGLKAVANCKQLEELTLANRPITAQGLASLRTLKKLKSLDLSWCDRLGPKIADVLRSFPSLKNITLVNNYLSVSQRQQIEDIEK